MKLTAFLFLAACLQVSAKGYSQTVTLSRAHVSLIDVFKEIQRQTGYNFLYTYEELERAGPVDVNFQNAPLQDAIESCLHDKPLTYTIVERTVVIKPKIPVPASDLQPEPPAIPPLITVRGRITDSLGEPLVNASITIKGTHTGTKTNIKGDFELKDIPSGSVLVISYTGYDNSEVTPSQNGLSFVIALRRSQDILDATVIQAYGTTSRRFSVGSIATVDAETIEKQPVTNVLLALQGQVAGLAINATSGVPGSQVLVQVRGQNTFSNGSFFKPYDQPLFIIDGVPFAPQNANISQLSSLATASTYSGGITQPGGISALIAINPNDIESISILKDADATSIYGTQGSNGVILITTKKGKPGKSVFDLTATTGFNTDARSLKLMNTQQYLQMRNDAFAADSLTPSNNPYSYPGYAPDLTIYDQNKYTNWQKVIFGKTSNNTDVHASLSGGAYNNTFLISAGYTRSDYNFPGNYADQRLTLHTTTHHSSLDNRLTVDFGTDFAYNSNNSPSFGASQNILLPPNLPDLLDASGNLVWNYKGADLGGLNFYAYLKKPVESNNYNLNNSLRIAYKIVTGLSITANLGYSRNTTEEHSENPSSSQDPLYPYPMATFGHKNAETINVEPQIDYSKNIGKGIFTALLGAAYKKNSGNSTYATGSGYANDNFLGSINGAASVYSSDDASIYKYSAGFSRLKYVYDKKYIISLTGRRDGSSNFGPGNQFGDFGSVGAGWIFSEEKAFKKALPVISYAKLSGSYGTSGSDGTAAYQYQSFWGPLGYAPSFQGIHPDFPNNLYNPNYSWALKKSLNVALDIGLFHDRLLVNATYYRDREGNQLAGYPLPAQVGFPSVLENVNAEIQNSGWEFSFSSSNVKTKNFTWTTNFNITANRNKLLSFPNLASSSYASQYVIGKPLSEITGYRFKGLNPATGLFEFYTADDKVTSYPNYLLAAKGGDEVPIADREVKFMGGFGNSFSYKQFNVYVFFQFSSQTAPTWLYTLYSSYSPGTNTNNAPVQALDYWKNPGDHTLLQRLASNYGSNAATVGGNFVSSSGVYGDDTYMRLKTLAVSYYLSAAALKKMHLQGCKIYVNAQNLLTFTDYKVSDPEQFSDYASFPLQRIVVCGLSFNF